MSTQIRPAFKLDATTAMQILQSRGRLGLINKPGKYHAKVTSVNRIKREDGTYITIINFNRSTGYQMKEVAIPFYQDGDYESAVGKGTSLSTSVLDGQWVPEKGEHVNIMVANHVNKDKINILVVDGINEIAVTETSAFDVEEALANLAVTAEQAEEKEII